MQTLLDDDPEAVMDPWANDVQPEKQDLPPLSFPRRTVWQEGLPDSDKESPDEDEDKESSDEDEVVRPDERKSVGKGAQKHQPPPPVLPITRTKTKVKLPASLQRTVDDMDVEESPLVEPRAPSSPPPPPSNIRHSVRLPSQSPGPSSALSERPDVATHGALDDIEEYGEDSDDKMSSRSNAIDLRAFSPVDSDRESPISPLTWFSHTFLQLFRFLRMTKVFYANHSLHHPLNTNPNPSKRAF